MALKDFNFTLICDSEFVEAGRAITAVGRHIKRYLISREYGNGVKEVAVGIVMRQLGIEIQRRRRPKYNRERRTSLLGRQLEDTLEFSVYPSLDAVRSAVSVRDLIEALRVGLAREADGVCVLDISGFDTQRFLRDLDGQLEFAENSSLWGLAEMGRFARSACVLDESQTSTKSNLSGLTEMAAIPNTDAYINEFPSQVLAFVERELPLVRRAAEQKDRTALGPLLGRVKKFIQPWSGVMTSQGGIFETFPDCGHLLPDMGRELAIECDQTIAEKEREHLHLEFQKRLEACRACAERIQKGRNKIK
jgi:hypothetical protein